MKWHCWSFVAAGLTLIAGVAAAEPSSLVTWDVDTLRLVRNGDPETGKALTESCVGCHGETGISTVPDWPNLAGQKADYMYKQLKDYQDGKRTSDIMEGMVAGLSPQDMADLAAFYAIQPLTAPGVGPAVPDLVRRGDGKRLIPACQSCHDDPKLRRHHGMAILDGLTKAYIVATLGAYKSGARGNDVYSVMRNIAGVMTDEEIAAVAAYYGAE
jgi:cytochrome c553